jgi:hypothetical protein
MWRKIWIRDIEGILRILKGNIPKNEAKEKLSRIEPLTSCFPLSDLDATLTLISSPKNSKLKFINIVKRYTVLMHAIISYYTTRKELRQFIGIVNYHRNMWFRRSELLAWSH